MLRKMPDMLTSCSKKSYNVFSENDWSVKELGKNDCGRVNSDTQQGEREGDKVPPQG